MHACTFAPIAHAAILATPVRQRLATRAAVVLERIARGGGATNWFFCSDGDKLKAIEELLTPGSAVTFYFDDRIQRAIYSDKVRTEIERVARETGDAIFGVLCADCLRLDITIVAGPSDLDDAERMFSPAPIVFYGPFPARDDDGVNAVTVVLPDADGIVRAHPH